MLKAWTHLFFRRIREIWPLLPAAAYLLAFLGIVLSYLVGLSFSLTINGRWLFPTLQTARVVFALPAFHEALSNTALFVVVGTPLELITGLFLALILYRNFIARDFVRSLFCIPLAVPALVTAILLFMLFDFPGGHINDFLLGKYGHFPAILKAPLNWRGTKVLALGISLLGKVWRDSPISMLILLAGLNTIDPELFDAAKTMGAGFRKRLWYLVLPLMIPSCATVVLLRSIEMWKEFIFPFVLAGKYGVLGTLIESLYNDWGSSHEASAVAVALVVCIAGTSAVLLWVLDLVRKVLMKEVGHERFA